MNNLSHRIYSYNHEHGFRRRLDLVHKIRKTKKRERWARRRFGPNKLTLGASTANVSNTINNNRSHARPLTPKQLHNIILFLQTTGDAKLRLEALKMVHRNMSLERDAPVKAIVDSGVLVTLKSFLQLGDQPQLLIETLSVLNHVVSSAYTAAAIQAGALPGVVTCLWHKKANIRELAIWCVGNAAGDSVQFRDEALKLGALTGVVENVNDPNHDTLYNTAIWAFCNLLRAHPHPDVRFVKEAGPCLAKILANPKTKESLGDSIWAMRYASDGGHECITALLQDQPHVVNVLVNLLEVIEPSHIRPLVRCLGNICAGTEDQAQLVVNAGITHYSERILNCPQRNVLQKHVKKDFCWMMSNIAAGSQNQIACLFSTQDGLSSIVKLAKEAEWGIRKEAISVLINIFTGGSDVQIDELVRLGGMEAICSVQGVNDVEILKKVMRALESILAAGERLGTRYKTAMEEFERLAKHFGAIDENESESLMPDANVARRPFLHFNFDSGL